MAHTEEIRLSTQEIVEGLRRIKIPEYEIPAAVESFEKWWDDLEEQRDRRAIKLFVRGRKFRRMM